MLRLALDEDLWWPVKLHQPKGDGSGATVAHDIEVRYRPLTREEMLDLLTANLPQEGRPVIDRLREADAKLIEHVRGWRGIADAQGEEIPFAEDTRARLMQIPWIYRGIMEGLKEASKGGEAKNSVTGPAG